MLTDMSIAKPLVIHGTDYSQSPISMVRWLVGLSLEKTRPTAPPHSVPQSETRFHRYLMRCILHGGKIHAMAFPKDRKVLMAGSDSLPYESSPWAVFLPVEADTVFLIYLRYICDRSGGRWCLEGSAVPLARGDARLLWSKRVAGAEWAGTVAWSSSHFPHEPEYITTVALHPTPRDPEPVC